MSKETVKYRTIKVEYVNGSDEIHRDCYLSIDPAPFGMFERNSEGFAYIHDFHGFKKAIRLADIRSIGELEDE